MLRWVPPRGESRLQSFDVQFRSAANVPRGKLVGGDADGVWF